MNRTIHICFLRYTRAPNIHSYRFADHFVDAWTTAVGHEDKVQAVIEPKRQRFVEFPRILLGTRVTDLEKSRNIDQKRGFAIDFSFSRDVSGRRCPGDPQVLDRQTQKLQAGYDQR